MSYIYEALKQAEDEHNRHAIAVRAGARRTLFGRRPHWWVWVLIGVLGANAAVFATLAVTLGSRSPGGRATGTETRAARSTPKSEPGVSTPPAARVAPAPVSPAPVAPAPVAPAPVAPAPVAPAPVAAAPRVEPATPPRPAVPVAPPSIDRRRSPGDPRPKLWVSDEPEPRPPAGWQKPPDRVAVAPPAAPTAPTGPVEEPKLALQVIVYSEVPSQRMVFIDGRRYVEGDAIDSETLLERIGADSAVVKRRGVRFVITSRRD